jgi:polyprenyl P-hydroxybenzoate/phenylacrylic acid decarboxylase-like protein
MKKRIILGMTGATGAIYGKRILEVLRGDGGYETHLVVSDAGALNIQYELGIKRSAMGELADKVHRIDDIAAPIASGGFKTDGMIIAPCSMKTLAAIAHGFGDNLISRAADVVLKERRQLVVIPREAPLNLAHVRNMVAVTEMGAIIYPPVPAFYAKPVTIDDLVDETVGRVLSLLEIQTEGLYKPWVGLHDGDN